MNILHIDNVYSWFLSENQEVKNKLWKALRFRDKGCYHNAAYRMKRWDGFRDFFKKESGQFLTGLLPEVLFTLKYLNVDFKIEDKRKKFEFLYDKIDDKFLYDENSSNPITLRDYQVDYINQLLKCKRGIIPSPAGSGKSNCLCGIVKAIPPKTFTLILCNKRQLVEQNYDNLINYGIENVGRFYGTAKEPNYITCATVQSCHLLEKLLPKIEVLIVDEAHEMTSKQSKKIYTKLKNAVVKIGMSATAFKFGGSDQCQKYDVKGWLGNLIKTNVTEDGKLSTKELQSRKILASVDCSFFVIDKPQLPYEIYLDAVTKGIAQNAYFNDKIVELINNLKGRTLILVDRLEHGDTLFNRIPGALWVRGEDHVKVRKQVIKRLNEEDNIVAIATAHIFGVGVDCPNISNLVNCSGGQGEHQIIQRFGRGLRTSKKKQHVSYYDFLFKINEYLEKHSKKRIKVLEKEGHKVSIYETIDDWIKNDQKSDRQS